MTLSKKTIKELQRLGLDTDWPSEDVAQFHIRNAQRQEKAERMKREAHREEVEAAERWPKEIHDGVDIVEVGSGREVVLQDLDLKNFTYGLLIKPKRETPYNKAIDDGGGIYPGHSTAELLSDIERGYKIVRGYTPPTLADGHPHTGYENSPQFDEQYQYWKREYSKPTLDFGDD